MKNALLTITTKQPEQEDLIFTTHTEYDDGENGIVFQYDETLSDDAEPVNTRLFVGDDNILVERSGETGGDMFFKKSTTYETKYRIPGGISLDMRVFTTLLNIEHTDNGLSAEVEYELFLGGAGIGGLGMNIKAEYLHKQ